MSLQKKSGISNSHSLSSSSIDRNISPVLVYPNTVQLYGFKMIIF